MLYLGIDQHARQITISLRDENGDVVQPGALSEPSWPALRSGTKKPAALRHRAARDSCWMEQASQAQRHRRIETAVGCCINSNQAAAIEVIIES